MRDNDTLHVKNTEARYNNDRPDVIGLLGKEAVTAVERHKR